MFIRSELGACGGKLKLFMFLFSSIDAPDFTGFSVVPSFLHHAALLPCFILIIYTSGNKSLLNMDEFLSFCPLSCTNHFVPRRWTSVSEVKGSWSARGRTHGGAATCLHTPTLQCIHGLYHLQSDDTLCCVQDKTNSPVARSSSCCVSRIRGDTQEVRLHQISLPSSRQWIPGAGTLTNYQPNTFIREHPACW